MKNKDKDAQIMAVNPVYRPLIKCRDRVIVMYGGADSGKSYFVGGQLLPLLHATQKGHRTLVVRKVARTVMQSAFQELVNGIRTLGWSDMFQVVSSEPKIRCPSTGSEFLFAGLDDVNKLKSIQGLTEIWVEEADEITADDFWQLLMRIRGREDYARMYLTFNPVDESSWTKTLFFDGLRLPSEGVGNTWRTEIAQDIFATVLHTTYHDNRFLSSARAAVLEGLKTRSPAYYRVYALGEYGRMGDMVLENWKTGDVDCAPDRHRMGLDWGFARDPLAWVKVALDKRAGVLYVLDEEYLFHTSLRETGEVLRAKVEKGWIVCDSAEPRSIAELREYGLRVQAAKKGPGSRESGIRFLQSLQWVVAPHCVHMLEELRGLRWKKIKGQVSREMEGMDHLVDAVRYALEAEIGAGGKFVKFMGD